MAFIKFLIITAVLAVGVRAKFVWQDDDFTNFPAPKMPTPPTPPTSPTPPTYPFFQPGFPFAPFPPSALFPQVFGQFGFPDIPLPVVPTPGQLRNTKPGPGEVFHGVAVQSSSSLEQDENGKWVRKGGTALVANDNGKVHEFKHGNAPPNLDVPLRVPTFPSFPEMKPLKFPSFPEIKPLEFSSFPEIKPIKMPKFKPIKPIDTEKMKTYQPKESETYFGSSSSSFTNSHTVNGKTVSEGASDVVINDNGNTDQEHVSFHKGDKLDH